MRMQKHAIRFIIAAVLLLAGCEGATATMSSPTIADTPVPTATRSVSPSVSPVMDTPVPTVTATPSPSPEPEEARAFHYGVVYAYAKSDWSEADRQDIRAQLAYLKTLRVNTVVQTFSSRLSGSGREQDWLIFLDEAADVDIQVIARLWPVDNNGMDDPTIEKFLAVVGKHPALLAYLGLHEPLEQFNSNQLRDFYSRIKQISPETPLANYMGNMAWFENSWRFPNRDFSAGICDLCIIWYYPVRYRNGQPDFEEDLLIETLRDNRELVTARAPEVQLWFLGQVYAQNAHPNQLRMSTPEEMLKIFTIAMEEGADGFLWYPWLHGNYDEVLGDATMSAQQQKVRDIYETYVTSGQTP